EEDVPLVEAEVLPSAAPSPSAPRGETEEGIGRAVTLEVRARASSTGFVPEREEARPEERGEVGEVRLAGALAPAALVLMFGPPGIPGPCRQGGSAAERGGDAPCSRRRGSWPWPASWPCSCWRVPRRAPDRTNRRPGRSASWSSSWATTTRTPGGRRASGWRR